MLLLLCVVVVYAVSKDTDSTQKEKDPYSVGGHLTFWGVVAGAAYVIIKSTAHLAHLLTMDEGHGRGFAPHIWYENQSW